MDTESRTAAQRVDDDPATGAADVLGGERTEDGVPAFPEQGVYHRLFREGYRFGFFQAARLLERLFPDAPNPGDTPHFPQERVRFRPSEMLVFPPADVKKVEWLDDDRGQLVTTMMGLYGIDSPMPMAFHEQFSIDPEETRPHRDFLDMFNQRLYAYFYRAWKKFRPGLHYRHGGTDAHSKRFVAAAGLGTPGALEQSPVPRMRLAALARRWSMRPHNAEGLEDILETLFDGLHADVVENVPRRVRIPSRPSLGPDGPDAHLGANATIGESVLDRTGKFRIELGPMDVDDYLDFLPGGDKADVLRQIVRSYAPNALDFDVELQVEAEDIPKTQLGDSSAQLGLTTCLGSMDDAVMARVIDYDESHPAPS